MAAAGHDVVPAHGRGGDPGWLGGVYGGGFGIDGDEYLGFERLALALYVVVLLCAWAIPGRALGMLGGLAVGAFILAPPLLSLDVFSYASYARLEVLHHLNPYSHSPSAAPGDQAAAFVEDWRGQVSVYGPLFTIGTLPLAKLGLGGFVWSLKAIAGACVLGTAWLVARLAVVRGLDPRPAAALVALNPLVLVHVVGGAHNDAVMMLVMTAAVAALVAGRELAGGAGIVAAAGVKASGAFAIPFALVGERRRSRVLIGAAATAAALVAIGLAAFGSSVTEAFSVVGANQDLASRASLPTALHHDLGLSLDLARGLLLALYGGLVAWLLVWTARGGDWIRAAGWAALGLLLASAYVTPWYVIWVLPLAAISRDRGLVTAAVLVTAFLLRYQVAGLGG
jgi:hypothetical protein